MPGRDTAFGSSSYRYGFNGKENDNEVKGKGNQIDYGMRVYDPRMGKFLSVDPLTKDYPELTAYQFASNSPIENSDLDGAESLSKIKENSARLMQLRLSLTTNQQKLSDQEKICKQAILQASVNNQPQITVSPAPTYTPYEQAQRKAVRKQRLNDAGYNSDGSLKPLTKLAENKTWNNLADNIALLMAGMAIGEGLGKIFSLGKSLMSFEDVLANPKAIWGKSADEVNEILGEGWKFTQDGKDGFISFSKGSSRHGNSPYYKINSGETGKIKVVGNDYKITSNEKSFIIQVKE